MSHNGRRIYRYSSSLVFWAVVATIFIAIGVFAWILVGNTPSGVQTPAASASPSTASKIASSREASPSAYPDDTSVARLQGELSRSPQCVEAAAGSLLATDARHLRVVIIDGRCYKQDSPVGFYSSPTMDQKSIATLQTGDVIRFICLERPTDGKAIFDGTRRSDADYVYGITKSGLSGYVPQIWTQGATDTRCPS